MDFAKFLAKLQARKPVILAGDMNTAPTGTTGCSAGLTLLQCHRLQMPARGLLQAWLS